MSTDAKNPFDKRAFVALVAATSGLGLPVTGIMNHVHQAEPMSLQRHAWMTAHNVLGLIFAAFAIWHVVLNRRALLHHVRDVASRVPRVSREALVAVTLVVGVVGLVVSHAFHAG